MVEPTQIALSGLGYAAKVLGPTVDLLKASANNWGVVAWHKMFGAFDTYLERSATRYSTFTSIAFPNAQLRLTDFYIPLTLIDDKNTSAGAVSGYPRDLLAIFKDILIVDMAGMGKSTLLRFIFLSAIREEVCIPILVDLRKLGREMTLLKYISEQLQELDKSFPEAVLFHVIQEGGFIFLLDGYDEISKDEVEFVTRDVQEFKSKANKNKYLMTSREERGLVAFADFRRLSIRPLTKTEAYGLIGKYSRGKEIGEALIAKIELKENESVREFLNNPLLVSLLFKSFEYKQTIPLKRHIFYRQVYEALFETHDLSKEGVNRSPKYGHHELREALSTDGRFGRLRRTGNRPSVVNAVMLIAMAPRSGTCLRRASAARIAPAARIPATSGDVPYCSNQCTR